MSSSPFHPPPFHPPPSLSLRNLELGHALPERLLWRAELASLSRLRRTRALLQPTSFPAPATPHHRNPHITHLAPSPDGALLAIAGSDARVEIHEPSDAASSRRLLLAPRDPSLKLSGLAWQAPGDADCLVAAFRNRPEAWLYDLQTCREDVPCRRFRLLARHDDDSGGSGGSGGSGVRGVSDVARVDGRTFVAATGDGCMRMVDCRVDEVREGVVGVVRTGMAEALVSADGMLVYAADGGRVVLYDRRVVGAGRGEGRVRQFGAGGGKVREEVARREVSGGGRFNFLRVLPRGAAGCVAYQTGDGGVGFLDLGCVEAQGVHVLEEDPRAYAVNGLSLYGAAQGDLERPWFVERRGCDVVTGRGGRGWRVVAPLVGRKGVRVVSFGSGAETRSHCLEGNKYRSCVHALAGRMESIVLGGTDGKVEVLQVDARPQKRDESGGLL